MRRAATLLLTAALAASIGCTSMREALPGRQGRTAADEVRELRQLLVDLQQRMTMSEVELERLRRQVVELETGRSAAGTESKGVSPAEPEPTDSNPVGPILPPPVVIQEGLLEVADLEPVESIGLTVPGGAAVEAAVPEAEVFEEASGAMPTVSEEGQALYDHGYTLFHRGQYLDAETVFQQFLGDFGATDLGDNAQFWIGEARYARQDLSGALAAFREVVSRYPEGNKVPDALLKAADCQRGLGDIEGARRSYREVVTRFPFAAAAAVAEDRVRDLP